MSVLADEETLRIPDVGLTAVYGVSMKTVMKETSFGPAVLTITLSQPVQTPQENRDSVFQSLAEYTLPPIIASLREFDADVLGILPYPNLGNVVRISLVAKVPRCPIRSFEKYWKNKYGDDSIEFV